MQDLVMSIDIGTQSIRAMIFNKEGRCVGSNRLVTDPPYALEPGWAEIPAPNIWKNVCQVLRELREKSPDLVDRVAACGITANRDNIIALDDRGNYIRDWITWIDQRRTPEAFDDFRRSSLKNRILTAAVPDIFKMITIRSKFNWFKYHEPETYRRAARYLTLGGLVTYKLTGEFADSPGMQTGVVPFNSKTRDFYKPRFFYEAMGVRRDQLADRLVKPAGIMGRVTAEASRETGLPEGLPIISAGGDKQCEVLGAGSFSPDTAVISYGTMATLSVTSSQYAFDRKFSYYSFASSIRDHYYEEFVIDRGYWLVTWFCREYAKAKDFPAFLVKMNEKAANIPAGSEGLFVFPFWTPHRVVYPHARGMVLGISDDHRLEHFYRAILEGIAYGLKMGYGRIRKTLPHSIKELIIVGGGSQSDVAMQLTADIFNVPTVRLEMAEVGGLGAAIPAGIYAGLFRDEQDAVKKAVKVKKTFDPIPENVAVYDDLYRDVFLKVYRANLPFFQSLQKIGEREIR